MSRIVGYYIRYMPYIMEKPDFNSDAYNNCLLIQKCVSDLDKKGLLTDFEKKVLQLYYEGYNTSGVSRELKVSRVTAENTFRNVTTRIAFILGGDFTDDAVISRLIDI